MENVTTMLAHLRAALELADTTNDHLLGAQIVLPITVLEARLQTLPLLDDPSTF